jgi:DNA (cytosine-5)-methyltransferase 1
MKFISLFSGIGGFDLGFERAGMECAAQVEIDDAAREVLEHRFPGVPKYTDVREFGHGQFDRGAVDLICGGFPCQDLSIAGKRAGLAGERSGLWFEFHRILAELAPRWVVIENVPGLLSSNGGRDFAVILRGLGELGYLSTWRILDAQYFGVPQRRRRVFIVASLGSGRAAQVLFEREGVSGDLETGREAGKDVAYSLRSNPSHSGEKGDGGINTTLINMANGGANQNNVKETNVMDTLDTLDTWASFAIANPVRTSSGRWMADGADNFVTPSIVSNGDSHSGFRDERGLIADVAPTLEAEYFKKRYSNQQFFSQNGDGFPVVSSGVRRLTPTECARLQGFPDDWNDWLSDTARYRQFGNAVAVPCAEWIGRRIMEAS